MNPYIDKPMRVGLDTPVEVAVNLWRVRFEMKIGIVNSVSYGYTIEVHRFSETEFALVLIGFTHKEAGNITSAVRSLTSETE